MAKCFGSHGVYAGMITSLDDDDAKPGTIIWRALFTDGDKEDYSFGQVRSKAMMYLRFFKDLKQSIAETTDQFRSAVSKGAQKWKRKQAKKQSKQAGSQSDPMDVMMTEMKSPIQQYNAAVTDFMATSSSSASETDWVTPATTWGEWQKRYRKDSCVGGIYDSKAWRAAIAKAKEAASAHGPGPAASAPVVQRRIPTPDRETPSFASPPQLVPVPPPQLVPAPQLVPPPQFSTAVMNAYLGIRSLDATTVRNNTVAQAAGCQAGRIILGASRHPGVRARAAKLATVHVAIGNRVTPPHCSCPPPCHSAAPLPSQQQVDLTQPGLAVDPLYWPRLPSSAFQGLHGLQLKQEMMMPTQVPVQFPRLGTNSSFQVPVPLPSRPLLPPQPRVSLSSPIVPDTTVPDDPGPTFKYPRGISRSARRGAQHGEIRFRVRVKVMKADGTKGWWAHKGVNAPFFTTYGGAKAALAQARSV